MVFWTMTFGVVFVAGCSKVGGGGKGSGLESADRRHILRMAGIYRQYLTAHNNTPPANTAALKEWALGQGNEKLKFEGSLEDALKSPRDGEPYYFVPPTKGPKRGPQTFLVYEKTGVKGKHLYAGEMANVGEMSDKELEESLQRSK